MFHIYDDRAYDTLAILDGIIVTIQPFYEKCKDEYLTYRRTSGVIAPFSKKRKT